MINNKRKGVEKFAKRRYSTHITSKNKNLQITSRQSPFRKNISVCRNRTPDGLGAGC
jgi:hypothetical protein